MYELALISYSAASHHRLISLALAGIASPHTRRAYGAALDEFLTWSAGQVDCRFTKQTVQLYRSMLVAKGMAPASINQRLAAVRRLAQEATDDGLLDPMIAVAISKVHGVRMRGVRLGRWLDKARLQQLSAVPSGDCLKVKRDRSVLALLIGGGLRRGEVADVAVEQTSISRRALGHCRSDWQAWPDSDRPVRLLKGRGTNCPVCRSRYGRFDVITPVSLGNSSALTHVARTLLRQLPAARRKLLVFTDSRQDAAHQSRFIEGAERLLLLRRFTHSSLKASPEPHDLRWLEEQVYQKYVEAGDFTARCTRDERERRRRKLDGSLLHEFVIAPNVRQSLERLGLVEIRYSQIEEELEGEDFARIVRDQNLDFKAACLGVKRLLDLFRTRRAVAHEALQRYLRGNDPVAGEYNITPGREVGIPVAHREVGKPSDLKQTYKLFSCWNQTGMPAGPQSVWRQTLEDQATEQSLDAVINWMLDGGRFLVRGRIGRNAQEVEDSLPFVKYFLEV